MISPNMTTTRNSAGRQCRVAARITTTAAAAIEMMTGVMPMPLAKVIAERPDVFNHNVEPVPRLYPVARRGSKFPRSARVLKMAKEMGGPDVVTKSGLMVGLGESFDEMIETFGLLREHDVQILTVGQYLRPTENHLPIERYWEPEEFEALEREGVTHISAYPGGASMAMHQALTRSKKIRTILPRHEQGGVFAAQGFARVTGRAGVVMALACLTRYEAWPVT